MTTLEYVLDPRFKAHGASFRYIGEARCPGLPESGWVSGPDLPEFLAMQDWATTAIVGHNLFFDAAILRWRYGVTTCRQWFDTLGMARYLIGALIPSLSLGKLHEHITGVPGKMQAGALNDVKGVRDPTPAQELALQSYAMDDINETVTVFQHMLPQFPLGEWAKMHWCIDMWLNPKLRLNTGVLQQVVASEQQKKAKLIAATGMTKTAISSNPQFAAALENLGVKVPTKISKTTGKRTYALAKSDQAFAALLGHEDSRVSHLVEARLAVKSTIDESRAERLLTVAKLTDGWLPVPLNYCGARQTARLSGGESSNLQNLGRGSMIRDAIEAPPGYVVLAADLSNIELRVNMVGCGQQDAVDVLRAGGDLYCVFATKLFGKTVTKADKTERMVGKVSELSLGYQSGGATFQQMLWVMGQGYTVTVQRAKEIVGVYRDTHPMVKSMWAKLGLWTRNVATANAAPAGAYHSLVAPDYDAPIQFVNDGIVMPSGFKIKYPNMRGKQVVKTDKETGLQSLEYTYGYTRFGKGDAEGFSFIHGGMVTENCLAGDTEVLTRAGWARLDTIAPQDEVWDGGAWVSHAGLTRMGEKSTHCFNNVRMTPDHRVWQGLWLESAHADERKCLEQVCSKPECGFQWPHLRRAGCFSSAARTGEAGAAVGCDMLAVRPRLGGVDERPNEDGESRLDVPVPHRGVERHSPDEQTPGVRRVSVYDGPMQTPESPSVEELRWAGDTGVPGVGGVRELLGGYGRDVRAGADPRAGGQRLGVLANQLPVGHAQGAEPKPPHDVARAAQGARGFAGRSVGGNGGQAFYDSFSLASRGEGRERAIPRAECGVEPVYDLINCGPNNRFMVRPPGGGPPFIVHNCAQALAAEVLWDMIVRVHRRTGLWPAMQVHDEIVFVVPEDRAEEIKAVVLEVMHQSPAWWSKLPVAAEAGYGRSYGEAK